MKRRSSGMQENRGVVAERAFLVSLVLPQDGGSGESTLSELGRLAKDAGAIVVGSLEQRRARPDPAYLFGKGKVSEIRDRAAEAGADMVIADADLSPSQVKNLESVIEIKVIDRTELILDIFASRAKTLQSKVQVELAQLEYTMPRLKRMWTHLSRMEGGIGMRGPGETQIETDRRVARRRLSELKQRIAEIDAHKKRQVEGRSDAFKVSLVGYTNAGKSSLMNKLTGAGVAVRDRLFETLDTRTRTWNLEGGRKVLLSDTVGFIRKLPHNLVASFHATLEEAIWADLLLHVVDSSAADASSQIEAVEDVLRQIGASTVPTLTVFNKSDLPFDAIELEAIKSSYPDNVCVSAVTGQGLTELQERILHAIEEGMTSLTIRLAPGDGATMAAISRLGRVMDISYDDEGSATVKTLLRRADVPTIRNLANSAWGSASELDGDDLED